MCVDDGEALFLHASPRRLNLRLFCRPKTPAKDKLDVWPALSLIIRGHTIPSGTDNIVAALGQSNRVCQVGLALTGWESEQVLAAMQVPFPELTDLRLWSNRETPPVLQISFLDWFCPASAKHPIGWHFVSEIAKTALVRYSPCHPLAF